VGEFKCACDSKWVKDTRTKIYQCWRYITCEMLSGMYNVSVRLHSAEGNEWADSIFVDLKRVDRRRNEEFTYKDFFVRIIRYLVMKFSLRVTTFLQLWCAVGRRYSSFLSSFRRDACCWHLYSISAVKHRDSTSRILMFNFTTYNCLGKLRCSVYGPG